MIDEVLCMGLEAFFGVCFVIRVSERQGADDVSGDAFRSLKLSLSRLGTAERPEVTPSRVES